MPVIHVAREAVINTSSEKLYEILLDMGQWPAWSPWLILEPGTKVDVTADRSGFAWDGSRVGAGEMVVTKAKPNSSIDYLLTFLRPFKSKAKVRMKLTPMSGGTKVTWSIDSRLPFFMFWMKKMMHTFIGMDYDRGLRLLKDYAEDGEIHSKISFLGTRDYPGSQYIGLKRSCSIAEMPELMGQDFQKLMPWAMQNGMEMNAGMAIYDEFSPIKDRCTFTSAVRYDSLPDDLPGGFIMGVQAPVKIYTIEHKGPYAHLGNGWAAMVSMIRNKEIYPIKNYPPFETYGNSPADTAQEDLIVFINFPVKSPS